MPNGTEIVWYKKRKDGTVWRCCWKRLADPYTDGVTFWAVEKHSDKTKIVYTIEDNTSHFDKFKFGNFIPVKESECNQYKHFVIELKDDGNYITHGPFLGKADAAEWIEDAELDLANEGIDIHQWREAGNAFSILKACDLDKLNKEK